jgi:colanic acid biosynthesis glycosyl transferase WcaI
MRILILTQYFAPEVGAVAIRLTRLARLLQRRGHDVQVLTGMPSYPQGTVSPAYRGRWILSEMHEGIPVLRTWVFARPNPRTLHRLLHQTSFALSALGGITLPRPDVIFVESHPLFVAFTGWALHASKRAPYVLNVSDLWPDSAIALGVLKSRHIIRLARWLERFVYRHAAHIIAMTDGIRKGVSEVTLQPEKVSLITNAVDLDCFSPTVDGSSIRGRFGLAENFVALYAGNLGLAQGLETLLDAAAHLRQSDPDIRIVIVGAGSRQEALCAYAQEHNLDNVIFGGVLPYTQMPQVLAAADVCLVLLKRASVLLGARPSKLYEAMAAGRAAIVSADGEAAEYVITAGAGLASPPEDSVALAQAIRRLRADETARQSYGRRGRAYAERHLTPDKIVQQIETTLKCASGTPLS